MKMAIVKKNKLLIAVVLAYLLLSVISMQNASKALHNSVYYLLEMLQVLPVIFLLTTLIQAWVPKEVIMRGLGENSGLSGKILSLVLGSISAGPIYAAFPICMMLHKKGASIANIVIIISAWAVIKVPMLANEAKFLSLGFMALRWILTVIAIFIMAQLMAAIVKKEDLPGEIANQNEPSIQVRQEYCIGCGLCAKRFPEYFEMQGGKAACNNAQPNAADRDDIRLTAGQCPTQAIDIHFEETDGE